MSKYEGHYGLVEKFGKTWRWFKFQGCYDGGRHLSRFKVEPYYEFDPHKPVPRCSDRDLIKVVEVRGTVYTFPARRMPCTACDGGIRRALKLRPHGGVCYCDQGTVVDFDYDKMTEEQKEVVAMYHLDQQAASFW